MANWVWILAVAGVIIVALASFAYQPSLSPGPQMSGEESFQLFLGIIGFGAIVWGITRIK